MGKDDQLRSGRADSTDDSGAVEGEQCGPWKAADPRASGEEVNGTSLAPVFDDPHGTTHLKSAAFSQFAKPSQKHPFTFWPTPARDKTEIMGYSVRTDEWRYTCWFGFDGVRVVPKVDQILGQELYDHRGDPGELDWRGEHVNVVHQSEHGNVVKQLHAMVLGYIRLYPVVAP